MGSEDLSVVNVVNGRGADVASSMNELVLHKQLTEAVRDLSDQKGDLQKCLVSKLKTVLQCSSSATSESSSTVIKIDNPNEGGLRGKRELIQRGLP